MQPKRTASNDSGPQKPYVPQSVGSSPSGTAGTRSQHAPPPPFFPGYPTRGPPPTSSGLVPPQAHFGYPLVNGESSRYDLQPPPPGGLGYQRPRGASYGYSQPPGYAGGPPPQPLDARSAGPPGSPEGRYPPYGAQPYNAAQRSPTWGNGDSRYPDGFHAPYTSAQRNGEAKPAEVSKEQDGAVQYRIMGDASKKGYFQSRVDVDAMAYKAVEGRDGATSPSQIESNRRDDVSNMGCTCKKSKCLKLYCVCFGASVMCGGNCRCLICHNTPRHEQSRKDAIRCILARNPSAFDTKFKKTEARAVVRPLAHKLGCKCRKSFCTKKYCECYNAGVKCSGSCRCVSCKNMPPGGFGNNNNKDAPAIPATPQNLGVDVVRDVLRIKNGGKHHIPHPVPQPPNSEHKMMDAAQNLAFLKHASPAKDPKRRGIESSRDNSAGSMPSLAASYSSGTTTSCSPDHIEPVRKILEEPKTPGGGVNTLLLAAYAMTELGDKTTANKSTPEKVSPPLGFRSPKRKSGMTCVNDQFADADDNEWETEEGDEESEPEKNSAPLMTPSDLRRIKRTRVGTTERRPQSSGKPEPFDATPRAEKIPTSDSEEDFQDDSTEEQEPPSPETEKPRDAIMTTPTLRKDLKSMGALTPVTARCIDFRHMDMGEKDTMDDEKKVDDHAMTRQ